MDQDDVLKLHEQLSALADGELDGDETAQLMAVPAEESGRLHASWQTYHLIGDVLRGGEQTAVHASTDFLSRLQGRLAEEAPLVPARPVVMPAAEPVHVVVRAAEPANDASFRWKMVAGCASFAAVAALAWSVVGGVGSTLPQAQLAAVPAPLIQASTAAPAVAAAAASQIVEQPVTLASGEAQVMLRDARLDELLAAHKQAGGSSALQMPVPAGLLRSATFTSPDR
ncbi:sigma-E factor negative regulatory protein [Pseudorhodoferax sp.]|uniref:sigma-E factor negative regulatory protein n=1 Tax=Pseudorhodoferax sp. TaxID=1993553 RepID=UPI002DD6B4F5|nr:sigma-E factor negative regulatory protein [Pseudorhodoferax sp.]